MLSNEEQAEIVYFQPTAPSRPLVRLINQNQLVNLEEHLDLSIKEILSS